jgi:carbonic anhydrase
MDNLIEGIQEFRESYVSTHRELFEQLSHGQTPQFLFITCSDSRIAPNLITQSDLGDLFVIRNAGNIMPPYGAANGGEGAALEYALQALGIEQIIVCGHSHCGAMKGLLHLNKLQEKMPLVYDWLKHAEATRRLVVDNYKGYSDEELIEIAVAENVLTQIENLKTYPIVRSRLFQGKLSIYGWIYHIETGEILAYDPETHAYIPPQTVLVGAGDDKVEPGIFVKTMAPPVACEVPQTVAQSGRLSKLVPSYGHSGNGSAAAAATPAQFSSAAPPASAQPAPANGTSWLSPEQIDRIYRGSVKR